MRPLTLLLVGWNGLEPFGSGFGLGTTGGGTGDGTGDVNVGIEKFGMNTDPVVCVAGVTDVTGVTGVGCVGGAACIAAPNEKVGAALDDVVVTAAAAASISTSISMSPGDATFGGLGAALGEAITLGRLGATLSVDTTGCGVRSLSSVNFFGLQLKEGVISLVGPQ